MEQEKRETQAADTIAARSVYRNGLEVDDGSSSGEGETSPEPPDHTAQYESTMIRDSTLEHQ